QLVEKPDAVPLPQGPGEIAFESVGFTYTPDVPVIREVSFVFPPGKTTALVGPSGGGKSTIIKLIMRMYEPDEGRVLIDGTDICDATFASLRERIAFVGQDTFLFSGSVAFNIGLGRPEASRDEIIEAAKVANAHDFIMAMPDGYDAPVGENGRNLSGGQRQRIAIARAVLKDSDILILDEATSALDSHSESAVRDAIEHAARGRTTIMIAHRLSTIAKADVVAYVEEGRIIETGTQAELLRLKGAYWKLYEKQELQAAS
ncbi:MAG: ATP-binding cassette domain-containing protein, partial [Rhodobiaceae bacterium]|nr:ATP-binding cassette domain-containing protein [Rhodobiaceae bacterium]